MNKRWIVWRMNWLLWKKSIRRKLPLNCVAFFSWPINRQTIKKPRNEQSPEKWTVKKVSWQFIRRGLTNGIGVEPVSFCLSSTDNVHSYNNRYNFQPEFSLFKSPAGFDFYIVFQMSEEAFYQSVIQTIPFSRHTLRHVELFEFLNVQQICIMHALIRMYHQF